MTIWKTSELETLFTCDCGETQTQLSILDWEDILVVTMSDHPRGFWRCLWHLFRYGEATYLDMTMQAETALGLSEELKKQAERIIEARKK